MDWRLSEIWFVWSKIWGCSAVYESQKKRSTVPSVNKIRHSTGLFLILIQRQNIATPLAGHALDGFCWKRYTAVPRRWCHLAVPIILTVGINCQAFPAGSVKGGGRGSNMGFSMCYKVNLFDFIIDGGYRRAGKAWDAAWLMSANKKKKKDCEQYT